MGRQRSEDLYTQARKLIPGGVNSPARSWRAVGGTPLFIQRGQGPYIWDADGNRYIDYVGSWGPLILGHAHPTVLARVKEALDRGTGFGAPTEIETELAERVVGAFPSMEMVRFVSSGTEAAMSALRLAKAYTKRDKIIKFDGGYHGHADALLVKAGSGAASHSTPDSAGVTASFAQDTLVSEYNDLDSVEAHFKANSGKIACVIVEPVAGNMGVVAPQRGFLEGLRSMTQHNGALLVFDEVITGFRVAYGGAQELYGVKPDITCLGKIIGGGLPVGAYGGRRDIMEQVSPLGPMYQAGTLSGNPVAMSAGVATLDLLRNPGVYGELESKGRRLAESLEAAFGEARVAVRVNRVGSMLTCFFTDQPSVTGWKNVAKCNREQYARFFHKLLELGVYFAPSPFEAGFVSVAHTARELERTGEVVREATRAVRG
jgi:glutamate-1-semialdehyde 2,1-aminomutase